MKEQPHTIGFFRQGKRFLSSVLFKKAIPGWCRIELIRNSYHKKGDNKPEYIGYLVPCKAKDDEQIKKPLSVLRKGTMCMPTSEEIEKAKNEFIPVPDGGRSELQAWAVSGFERGVWWLMDWLKNQRE